MKTKTEKKLVFLSIILAVTAAALFFVLLFTNHNTVIPNKDKFSLDKENYASIGLTSVGNGLFCIDHLRYYPALEIRHASDGKGAYEIVLDYVHEYKFENEILYCYAEDGYAIVYPESNLCKVLVTPPENLSLDGIRSGRIESNNYCINKISRDDFHENKLVVYLDSFDEFTEYEQKMLKSLK